MRYWCNSCKGYFAIDKNPCEICQGSDIDTTVSDEDVNQTVTLLKIHEHGDSVAMLVGGQKVMIDGGEDIGKHFDDVQSVEKIIKMMASTLPRQFVKDTQFICTADNKKIQFGLYHEGLPISDQMSTKEVTFEFTIKDGGKDLHIDFAKLGSELQGKGLMQPMMLGITEIMELAPKVERISLLANIDVGGYAWSRYGFKPDNPEQEVAKLTGKITTLLKSKTIQCNDQKRTVDISSEVELALEELLQKVDNIKPSLEPSEKTSSERELERLEQAQQKFQLLANVQTKIKVQASTDAVTLLTRTIPGGGEILRLVAELKEWEEKREEDDKAEGEIAKRLEAIKQKIVVFSDALSKIGAGAEVPGTKYVADEGGKKAIENILELLNSTQDPIKAGKAIKKFQFSVTANEMELPLSMALMLGSNWDGHVDKGSPEMETLKKYCQPRKK